MILVHERIQALEERIASLQQHILSWVEKVMSSTSGWILEPIFAQHNRNAGMDWTEEGSVVSFREPWHPTFMLPEVHRPRSFVEWFCCKIWIRYGLQRYASRENDPNWVPLHVPCSHLRSNRVQHYFSSRTSMRVVSMFDTILFRRCSS